MKQKKGGRDALLHNLRVIFKLKSLNVTYLFFKFTVVRIDMNNFRVTMFERQISIDENLYLANMINFVILLSSKISSKFKKNDMQTDLVCFRI